MSLTDFGAIIILCLQIFPQRLALLFRVLQTVFVTFGLLLVQSHSTDSEHCVTGGIIKNSPVQIQTVSVIGHSTDPTLLFDSASNLLEETFSSRPVK